MARSAHAYVRGNTGKLYEWLAADGRVHPQGPSVWICGDCHLGNLGPIADADGNVQIQIRDLDQTVIGDPAHSIGIVPCDGRTRVGLAWRHDGKNAGRNDGGL